MALRVNRCQPTHCDCKPPLAEANRRQQEDCCQSGECLACSEKPTKAFFFSLLFHPRVPRRSASRLRTSHWESSRRRSPLLGAAALSGQCGSPTGDPQEAEDRPRRSEHRAAFNEPPLPFGHCEPSHTGTWGTSSSCVSARSGVLLPRSSIFFPSSLLTAHAPEFSVPVTTRQ